MDGMKRKVFRKFAYLTKSMRNAIIQKILTPYIGWRG